MMLLMKSGQRPRQVRVGRVRRVQRTRRPMVRGRCDRSVWLPSCISPLQAPWPPMLGSRRDHPPRSARQRLFRHRDRSGRPLPSIHPRLNGCQHDRSGRLGHTRPGQISPRRSKRLRLRWHTRPGQIGPRRPKRLWQRCRSSRAPPSMQQAARCCRDHNARRQQSRASPALLSTVACGCRHRVSATWSRRRLQMPFDPHSSAWNRSSTRARIRRWRRSFWPSVRAARRRRASLSGSH